VVADDQLEVERLPFGALRHWLPMIGVATMFGHGFFAPVAPQCTVPTGVCTFSFEIALATAALSFGLPLAFSAAAATSHSARLAPSCWLT
jgi:hypothetical protein